MQTTRVCSVSDLHPGLYRQLEKWIRNDDPVQYCVEGTFTDSKGEQLRTAIVLTLSTVLYATVEHSGGGYAVNRKYIEIQKVEETTSPSGKYHYIRITVLGTPDSIRFDFLTIDEVHSFANILRRLARL